jgi:hypothetical protein
MQLRERVLEKAKPRSETLEGFSFEKLIRQLHVECSRKGKGDFPITSIEVGFWNRARSIDRLVEIDIVALNKEAGNPLRLRGGRIGGEPQVRFWGRCGSIWLDKHMYGCTVFGCLPYSSPAFDSDAIPMRDWPPCSPGGLAVSVSSTTAR